MHVKELRRRDQWLITYRGRSLPCWNVKRTTLYYGGDVRLARQSLKMVHPGQSPGWARILWRRLDDKEAYVVPGGGS